MRLYLHVELAQDLGPVEDAKGDLVDAVVLHVEGVDGGELRGSAHRVRLEAVPSQGQTGQIDQAGQEALRGVRGQSSHTTIPNQQATGIDIPLKLFVLLEVLLI